MTLEVWLFLLMFCSCSYRGFHCFFTTACIGILVSAINAVFDIFNHVYYNFFDIFNHVYYE